jgi:hypothetical protein
LVKPAQVPIDLTRFMISVCRDNSGELPDRGSSYQKSLHHVNEQITRFVIFAKIANGKPIEKTTVNELSRSNALLTFVYLQELIGGSPIISP